MSKLVDFFRRVMSEPNSTIMRDQVLIRQTSEARIRKRAAQEAHEKSRERIDALFQRLLDDVRGKAP